MELAADDFKRLFRNHPAGVTIITADAGSGPVGLTATSVSSVSSEPPLLVFSISSLSSSAPTLGRASTVIVHFLTHKEVNLAHLFAQSRVDRFAESSDWERLPTGEPKLTAVGTWLRGQIVNLIDAGNATIVVIRALEAEIEAGHQPLVHHNREWHRVGAHSRLT